jgi:putative transposase
VTFALDCHDREAISWAATTGGHSGDVVRDVMLAAFEQRFGATQADAPIEWLSDNGSAYIDHRTRSFARELGLKPLTTPVRSPQSNGMAESFVKTMKHDYVAFMAKPDVPTALSNLAAAFECRSIINLTVSACPELQGQLLSASSSFIRFISAASMPTYLARHL